VFNWAYIKPGANLKDPQLSVAFAPQEKLPPKIFFFGCELDMLCRESEVMAERLALERSHEHVKPGDVWEKAGIKWEKILGEEHGRYHSTVLSTMLTWKIGFDQVPTMGEKKVRVEKRGNEMYQSAAQWLTREVYA
jgi:hypothetical protein